MGGANGLIVAFVVAVWAAYFVPLVLRRYDDASTSSSLESLSPLSRVIARKQRDDVVADQVADDATRPPRAAAPESDQAGTGQAESGQSESGQSESGQSGTGQSEGIQALDRDALAQIERPVRPQVSRRAAAVAAKRRRRTLLTLLTALLIVGGLTVFSVIEPVWVAVPAAVVVAWLVACRIQVRGERGLARARQAPKVRARAAQTHEAQTHDSGRRSSWLRLPRRRPRTEGSAAPVSRSSAAHEEETVIVELDDVEPERPHVMEEAALSEDALDDQVVIAVPSLSTSGEAVWDPLPVTLPTYVTKPRAGRTVRTIDFDAPDAWTSGHIEGQDVELPGRGGETGDEPRRASGQ